MLFEYRPAESKPGVARMNVGERSGSGPTKYPEELLRDIGTALESAGISNDVLKQITQCTPVWFSQTLVMDWVFLFLIQ